MVSPIEQRELLPTAHALVRVHVLDPRARDQGGSVLAACELGARAS
jgi:hypothetical protein